ncbi:MAG: ribosomal RNA small subunit methyltransferase A [Planctomycetaceae bacterium]|nr:ribosomal RNA small subunit methyltransferase A [Planctomycetaceae bacterium]
MKDVQRQTRSYLMALFQQHGFNPRTDLGQNFLIDVNLIEFVVRHADLSRRDVVLEVGSGTGGMTAFLAAGAGHVVSIEVDHNMYQLAQHAVQDCDNVTLINRDILKNKNTLAPEIVQVIRERLAAIPDSRLKLVANLPYSVGTPVMSNLVASDLPWQRMVVTIQWELGQKMAAEAGSSAFSALSVWFQSQASVRVLRRLGPKVFWPRPGVDSAIVSVWRDEAAAARIDDRAFFLDFIRRLFHQRRKLLRSVLCGMYRKQMPKSDVDAILAELGHSPSQRAELMEIADLIELSNRMRQAVTSGEKSAISFDDALDDETESDGVDDSEDVLAED